MHTIPPVHRLAHHFFLRSSLGLCRNYSMATAIQQQQQRPLRPASVSSTNDFTHIILGGGVVGLAIAARLSRIPHTDTVVLERHGMVGMETSSRNSEVIHAGIYYPKDSLKTKLCIDGAKRLYQVLPTMGVGHKKVGKWIVAQTPNQLSRLHQLHEHATALGIPTRFLSQSESSSREPLIQARAGVLESPNTGILDSHGFMSYLESVTADHDGTIIPNSTVTHLSALNSENPSHGYQVTVRDSTGVELSITSDIVINAAGLGAVSIHNLLIGSNNPEKMIKPYFAKGTYYSATGVGKINTLIYPVVEPGLGGLGTHLTLDLAGHVRFGPDVEWVDSPEDLSPRAAGNVEQAEEAVREYLPGIDRGSLTPDYCGMRPKLLPKGSPFQDFIIREEVEFPGFVNLLGIESPGLTSSLAIAKRVEEILYGEGEGDEEVLD